MKRLAPLSLFCLLCLGAAVYSPKYAEHFRSLTKVTTPTVSASLPDMTPFMAPIPPNTNLYYTTFYWANLLPCSSFWKFNYGPEISSMTNWISFPATNSTFSVNVSNLILGKTYWFDFREPPCSTNEVICIFPSPQPPYSNTVTVTCIGPLKISPTVINPNWTITTNRVFTLAQNTNLYFKGANVSLAVTNNQVKNIMHKQ